MSDRTTEIRRLTELWMEKTGGNVWDGVNWALDIIAEDDKILDEGFDFNPSDKYTPLRDYLEELEKRLL